MMMTQEKAYELNYVIGQHFYRKMEQSRRFPCVVCAVRWVFGLARRMSGRLG